mmetsp:Transcript_15998/g.30716  ORF Transcript_15998/g.30716 Transcript_15998/m.30716 type:complete len:245 (-) Transcript_15998:39-773(-)
MCQLSESRTFFWFPSGYVNGCVVRISQPLQEPRCFCCSEWTVSRSFSILSTPLGGALPLPQLLAEPLQLLVLLLVPVRVLRVHSASRVGQTVLLQPEVQGQVPSAVGLARLVLHGGHHVASQLGQLWRPLKRVEAGSASQLLHVRVHVAVVEPVRHREHVHDPPRLQLGPDVRIPPGKIRLLGRLHLVGKSSEQRCLGDAILPHHDDVLLQRVRKKLRIKDVLEAGGVLPVHVFRELRHNQPGL